MMDCSAIEALLTPLLDGELDAAEALAVRSHLVQCPGCARRLETLQAIRAAVAGSRPGEQDEEASDGWPALARRLRTVDRQARQVAGAEPIARRGRWTVREGWKVAAALAAAVLLATSLWVIERRGSSAPSEELAESRSPGSAAVAPVPSGAPGAAAPSPTVSNQAETAHSADTTGRAERVAGDPSSLSELAAEPCGSAEDCGSGARRLWPAFPL